MTYLKSRALSSSLDELEVVAITATLDSAFEEDLETDTEVPPLRL